MVCQQAEPCKKRCTKVTAVLDSNFCCKNARGTSCNILQAPAFMICRKLLRGAFDKGALGSSDLASCLPGTRSLFLRVGHRTTTLVALRNDPMHVRGPSSARGRAPCFRGQAARAMPRHLGRLALLDFRQCHDCNATSARPARGPRPVPCRGRNGMRAPSRVPRSKGSPLPAIPLVTHSVCAPRPPPARLKEEGRVDGAVASVRDGPPGGRS